MILAQAREQVIAFFQNLGKQHLSDRIFILGASILIAGLFFSRAFISIGTAIVLLSFFFRLYKFGLKGVVKPIGLAGLALLLYLALTYFWVESSGTEAYLHQLRIKAGWLALLIGMAGLVMQKSWLKLLCWQLLLYASIIAMLSVVNYLLHFDEINDMIRRSKPIPIANGHWHISFSYMLAFSVFAGYYLVRKGNKQFRSLALAFTIVNFICLHILTARTGLVSFYGTIFILMLRLIVVKGKWKQGLAAIIGVAVAGVLAVAFIPSLQNRYQNSLRDFKAVLNDGNANFRSGAMRVKAMQAGWIIFKKAPIAGVGMGDLKKAKEQAYLELNAMLLPQNQINPHNQFLNFMCVGGLIALVLFAVFWLLPLLKPEMVSDRSLLITFMVISFVAMNFEALLERQIGTAFFVFFFLLLASPSKSDA